MFSVSELFSASMDRERVGDARPAYVWIIRQLSSDEAKIRVALNGRSFDYVYAKDYDTDTNLFPGPPKVEVTRCLATV
jgi:hypothetical protein